MWGDSDEDDNFQQKYRYYIGRKPETEDGGLNLTTAEMFLAWGRGSGEPTFRGRGNDETTFRGRGRGQTSFRGRGNGETSFRGRGNGKTVFRGRGNGKTVFRGRGSGGTVFRGRGSEGTTFRGTGSGGTTFRGTGSGETSFRGRGGGETAIRGGSVVQAGGMAVSAELYPYRRASDEMNARGRGGQTFRGRGNACGRGIGQTNLRKRESGETNEEILPIMEHVDEILKLYETEKVLALSASTGSGKSTILPAELATRNPPKIILVIVPTVNACNALTRRVRDQYPKLNIGSAAGRVIRYNDDTQLVFATAGHVVNMLLQYKSFRHFTDIILDEAHTVSVDYELIAALVQAFGLQGIGLMIITATFYSAIITPWQLMYSKRIEVFELVVPMFEIEETFTDAPVESNEGMLQAIIDYLSEKNKTLELGHFLVFCPGEEMIDQLFRNIRSDGCFSNCEVFCAYSSQPMEENDRAFDQKMPCDGDLKRAIILATNIAETSVTIPGVRWVIDTGKQKIVTIGENDAVRLETVTVSDFAAKQRAGRTGRTNPGTVHRMYSYYTKESLSSTYSAELQRTPLTQVILKFLSYKVCPMEVLGKSAENSIGEPWIDNADIKSTICKLGRLGLLDENNVPTEEALAISGMTLHLPLRRCLFRVQRKKTLADEDWISIALIAIAEVESTQTLQYYRRQRQNESKESFSEFLATQRTVLDRFKQDVCCPMQISLNVFLTCCRESQNLFEWCWRNSINSKAMHDIKVCLFRMGNYQLQDFARFDMIHTRKLFTGAIPLFVAGYEHQNLEFAERDGNDKWFCSTDPSFHRLNRRGFGSGFILQTNRILALSTSEIARDNGRHLSFINVYMPLEPLEPVGFYGYGSDSDF